MPEQEGKSIFWGADFGIYTCLSILALSSAGPKTVENLSLTKEVKSVWGTFSKIKAPLRGQLKPVQLKGKIHFHPSLSLSYHRAH